MIKTKFSQNYWAVQKRIQRLPKIAIPLIDAKIKKDASNFIQNFHDGIMYNSFGLKVLQDGTIQRKRQLGMELPDSPLYGMGDEKRDRSYVNMMRLRKIKKGWRVRPSIAMHYSGKVKLRTLYYVHEFGMIINTGKAIINIPPRPAGLKAYEKTLRDRSITDNTKKVKNAMREYIRTARIAHINQMRINFLKGLEKLEE